MFWLARYIERAENLARILDVQETFARDSRGAKDWMAIVQLNADEKRFLKPVRAATAQNVVCASTSSTAATRPRSSSAIRCRPRERPRRCGR